MPNLISEIRKVFGGMIKDLISELVPKDKYIDAQNINLSQYSNQTKGGAPPALGNEFKITKKEINFALSTDDYKGYRIALDLTADGISHVFVVTDSVGTVIDTFAAISLAGGSPQARYDEMVAQINAADPSYDVYIPSALSNVSQVVYVGFKINGFDYSVAETIDGTDYDVFVIKEYYGPTVNGVFQPIKSFNIGNDLHIMSTNGDVFNWGVAVKDETTEDWTYTTLLQTKQIAIETDAVVDLDGEIDFGNRVSLYMAGKGFIPRAFYVIQQTVWGEYYAMVYNENPDYIQSGNPDGQYTYENIDLNSRIQITENLATVSLTSVNNTGGSLPAASNMYLVQQVISENSYSGFSLVSDPIPIFSDATTDLQLSGNEGGADTTKTVTLSINNLNPNNYTQVRLVCVRNIDGAMTAILVGEYDITGESISVTHTGNEPVVSIALTDLVTNQILVSDAGNLVISRNRLFISNVALENDPDVSEWAKTHSISTQRQTIDAIGTINSTVNEYQKPENVFNYTGYMLNETYRLGTLVFYKSGVIATYFTADWTCEFAGSGALTVGGGSTPDSIYAYFPRVVVDTSTAPDIDGVPFNDAIYGYSIVRQECIPEVLASGIFLPSTSVGLGFYSVGQNVANPTYADFIVSRRLGAFLSMDLLMNQAGIIPIVGDKLLNYGQPTLYNTVTQTATTVPLADYCILKEFNGIAASFDEITIDEDGEYVPFNSISLSNIGSDKYITVIGSPILNQASLAIHLSVDADNITGETEYGFYIAQYFRALTDKYGDEDQGTYFSCGHFRRVESGTTSYSEDVFGGDTFTQKNFIKFANEDVVPAPENFYRHGVSFYSQNRGNYQLRYFAEDAPFPDYPYTTDGSNQLVQWLSGTAPTFGQNSEYAGTLTYSTTYTPINQFQTFQGFDPEAPVVEESPNLMLYSDLKLEGQLGDPYRIFRALNQKAYPLVYGTITNTFSNGNYITVMMERAIARQEINQQAVIQSTDSSSLILGDGSVLGAREVYVSFLGSPIKTAAIQYLTTRGDLYIQWYNPQYKKDLRLAGDGIRDLGVENQMQSFFIQNGQYIQDNWSMVYGFDFYNNEVIKVANYDLPDAVPFDLGNTYTAGDVVYVEGYYTTRKYYKALIDVPEGIDPTLPSSLTQYWEIYRQSNYTLAFNEDLNAYSTFYSYTPVLFMPYKNTFLTYCAAGGLDLNIYEHNKWTNQFYDDPVLAFITFVYNDMSEDYKSARNVFMQITDKPVYINFLGLDGSLTYAAPADITQKRDYWWSYAKNDATVTAANPSGINSGLTARIGGETIQVTIFYQNGDDVLNVLKEASLTMKLKPRRFNT